MARFTAVGSSSRSTSSAFVWITARGVRSWCEASAMNRRCAAIVRRSRSIRSFTARTSGATSAGARSSSTGERSSAERRATVPLTRVSGRRPRETPNQRMPAARRITASCASASRTTSSRVREPRPPTVSATCTSTEMAGLVGYCVARALTRTGSPRYTAS